jgi:hypothetical protein
VSVYELGDLSAEELTKNAEEGLGPKLTEEDGFLMYLGATVKSSDNEDLALFMCELRFVHSFLFAFVLSPGGTAPC